MVIHYKEINITESVPLSISFTCNQNIRLHIVNREMFNFVKSKRANSK